MISSEEDEVVAFDRESGAEAARPKVEACKRMEASVDMHSVREYADIATEWKLRVDKECACREGAERSFDIRKEWEV